MDKIEILKDYVSRGAVLEYNDNSDERAKYIEEVYHVFARQIPSIQDCIHYDEYGRVRTDDTYVISIKQILKNKICDIELEEQLQNKEIEKLKLQQSIISIQNNPTSISNSNATNYTNISLEHVIENVSKFEDSTLSQQETELLIGLLTSLDIAKKKNDKDKTQEKFRDILKFIADKTVQVGIAVLPYVVKAIQQTP
jgi:hypothetical protein